MRRSISKLAGGAAAFVAVASLGLALTPSAHAEDFFSALFGGFRGRAGAGDPHAVPDR